MSVNNTERVGYLRCRKRYESKGGCEGAGMLRTQEFEQLIYLNMVEKLKDFRNLSARKKRSGNPQLNAVKNKLAQVETERKI